jgi:hypothetical protein
MAFALKGTRIYGGQFNNIGGDFNWIQSSREEDNADSEDASRSEQGWAYHIMVSSACPKISSDLQDLWILQEGVRLDGAHG